MSSKRGRSRKKARAAVNSGQWTEQEKFLLLEGLKQNGIENFEQIAKMIPGRTADQVKVYLERRIQNARPKFKNSSKEDARLHKDDKEEHLMDMSVKMTFKLLTLHPKGESPFIKFMASASSGHPPTNLPLEKKQELVKVINYLNKTANIPDFENAERVLSILYQGTLKP